MPKTELPQGFFQFDDGNIYLFVGTAEPAKGGGDTHYIFKDADGKLVYVLEGLMYVYSQEPLNKPYEEFKKETADKAFGSEATCMYYCGTTKQSIINTLYGNFKTWT